MAHGFTAIVDQTGVTGRVDWKVSRALGFGSLMAHFRDEQRVGTEVDTYRIDALLGVGGMGAVYKGTHTWTGREVAVKFLHAHLARDEQSVRRFMREARAAAALRHPNVVDILDMGCDAQGDVYLVMELLRGLSLQSLLSERGTLSPQEALTHVLPLMGALSSSHALGVVHRDLKPDNIFLERGPEGQLRPKLLDYGLAKFARGSMASHPTASGAILGTPQYMSPEQANSESDVGPAADVWATGMVLYRCLSGSLPFEGTRSLPALLLRLVSEDIPPIRQAVPGLPPALALAVDRALQREPAARWPSMDAFAAALRASLPAGKLPPIPARQVVSGEEAAVDLGPLATAPTFAQRGWSSYGPVADHPIRPAWSRGRSALWLLAVGVLVGGSLWLGDTGAEGRPGGAGGRQSVTALPAVGVRSGPSVVKTAPDAGVLVGAGGEQALQLAADAGLEAAQSWVGERTGVAVPVGLGVGEAGQELPAPRAGRGAQGSRATSVVPPASVEPDPGPSPTSGRHVNVSAVHGEAGRVQVPPAGDSPGARREVDTSRSLSTGQVDAGTAPADVVPHPALPDLIPDF